MEKIRKNIFQTFHSSFKNHEKLKKNNNTFFKKCQLWKIEIFDGLDSYE